MTTMNEQLVRVTWHDAHAATSTWTSVDGIDDSPCIVESIGYLLHEMKPGHILLAQSWIADQEDVDGVLAIPSGMVKRIESLHALPLLPVEPAERA